MRPLPTAFGVTVRKLREQEKTSQDKFAVAAGISRTYMSEIERGVTVVSLDTIAKIAAALGTTMSVLLQEVEDAM